MERLALAEGFGHHAGETGRVTRGERELEDVFLLRDGREDVAELVRVAHGLVERGIRCGLHDAEDDTLVLLRREFLRGDIIKRYDEQRGQDRDGERYRPEFQRADEQARVNPPDALETARDPTGVAAVIRRRA